MVCAPEWLVFEANPDLDPPLKQERREAAVHDGDPLDTKAACIDLNVVEQAELHQRKAAAAHSLRKEAEAAKKAFIGEKIEKAVACGIDRDKARLMAEQWGKGILRPGFIVEFDDPDLGAVSVADVLANPDHYDRQIAFASNGSGGDAFWLFVILFESLSRRRDVSTLGWQSLGCQRSRLLHCGWLPPAAIHQAQPLIWPTPGQGPPPAPHCHAHSRSAPALLRRIDIFAVSNALPRPLTRESLGIRERFLCIRTSS